MTKTDFDLAIIGASLGGTSAGLELTGSGIRIAIFDKDHFPRKKICGEGLSVTGADILREIGISQPFLKISGYKIWKNGSSSFLQDSSQKAGYAVSRVSLDNEMFELLTKSNWLTPFPGVKIRQVEQAQDYVKLCYDSGSITAKKLVIADGAKSLIAKRLKVPTTQARNMLFGASLSCETDTRLDTVQLIVEKGYESYVTPISSTRINLSFLGSHKPLGKLLKKDELSSELARLEAIIGIRLTQVDEIGGIGPIAPITRRSAWGNALLVGDACESLDPLSGTGMTHALLTGQLAGRDLRGYFHGETSWEQTKMHYLMAQKSISQRLRGYSRAANVLVRHLSGGPILNLSQRVLLPEIFRNAAYSKKSGAAQGLLSLIGTSL